MPVPHFNIKITQRSKGKSAVAGAAYQAGEKLFSEYDQKTKNYTCKKEVVYTEIMLPPNAPPEYADRATLWNSVEEIEKQWNSQLARRFVVALPREVPMEMLPQMVKEYCEEHFVSKGMCCDFAIHDPYPPGHNPHCHFMLTMRAIDENGKWLPKSRKVYDLDENGERIKLPSGRWKSHKEDTVDWNEQYHAEEWRHGWEVVQNKYLELAGSPERIDADCETHKAVHDKYIKIGWKIRKEAYAESHKDELTAFNKAYRTLKKHGADLNVDLKALQKEYDDLKISHTDLKAQLAEVNEELKPMKDIRYWVGKVLSPEQTIEKQPEPKHSLKERLQYEQEQKKKEQVQKAPKQKKQDIMSDTDTTFNFILAMLQSQLINLLCDRADDKYGGRLPVHVRLILDEFANIGQIPNFDKLIATIRSREISASIILQSQSQLKAIYKDAAEIISDNCDSVLFLSGRGKNAKEISDALGKETIDSFNTSENRGSQTSHGLNYQKLGKALMSEDEIAIMDGGRCILQLRGVRPFFSEKFDITKHPHYKYLADADKKNTFDVDRFLSTLRRKRQQVVAQDESFDLYEIDLSDENAAE